MLQDLYYTVKVYDESINPMIYHYPFYPMIYHYPLLSYDIPLPPFILWYTITRFYPMIYHYPLLSYNIPLPPFILWNTITPFILRYSLRNQKSEICLFNPFINYHNSLLFYDIFFLRINVTEKNFCHMGNRTHHLGINRPWHQLPSTRVERYTTTPNPLVKKMLSSSVHSS